MARKPLDYWEKRQTELMKRLEKGTEKTINSLVQSYEQATKNINKEIVKIYNNFAKDTGLSKKVLTQLLSSRETEQYYKNLLQVIKNNITRRALAEAGIEGLEDLLEGPTAVIMNNDDYLETAKTIYNYSKDNDFYKIKGGVIDGKVMTAEEIITLAKLPSRETLLSMLAGALLGNISKLAVALGEVQKQKENA